MTATSTEQWTTLLAPAVAENRDGVPVIGSIVNGKVQLGNADPTRRISPATGQPLFVSADCLESETDDAVSSVRSGFDAGAWGRASGRDRARVLHKAAELLESRAEEFAKLLVLETGKPIREARGEVAATVNSFEYFAGLSRDIGGRTARDISRELFAFTLREPAGVAGIIVPWNFPLAILGQKLPPALAAGCTAVVKPSPLTPLTALAAAQVLFEAGLPEDALSIVLGDGPAGSALVVDPRVDVVSFTGSTATGRRIAAAAGSNRLKRVAIEAGGKTPVFVLRDADIEAAVEGLLFAAYFNQGQVCVAGSRILADVAIADELTAGLAARAAKMRLGEPTDPATEMGPLIAQHHFEHVVGAIEEAARTGADVVTGGQAARPNGTAATPFLQPTLLTTSDDDNRVVKDEIFGPVTVVQSYRDLGEAVARANASEYGLAASVWTTNLDAALDTLMALRTGTVWVNGSTDAFPELPLGGRRDSGYAAEFGREGMEFFTEIKTVQIRRAPTNPWYSH